MLMQSEHHINQRPCIVPLLVLVLVMSSSYEAEFLPIIFHQLYGLPVGAQYDLASALSCQTNFMNYVQQVAITSSISHYLGSNYCGE